MLKTKLKSFFSRLAKFKYRRPILIVLGSFILLVVLVIVFISPLTKYYIEKNDVKFTGREIKMDWVYVNPFTGYIMLKGLKIYENKSDTFFLSTKGLSLNFTMYKLLSKNYEINSITLDRPIGRVIQIEKIFNFFDIIEKFATNDKPKKKSEPLHFNILNIKLVEGTFYYGEPLTPIRYFIKNVNIESSGKFWNKDVIDIKFGFKSGIGTGDMKGKFIINTENLNYNLAVKADTFDLKIIEQYLKDMVNYGKFRAYFDANIEASGNFRDAEKLIAKGRVALNDFHFGKNEKEDFVSFKKLMVDIIELSPMKQKYLFDSIILAAPYCKYERYDSLDNIQRMFGSKGSNVKSVNANPTKFNLILKIAKYVKELAENFLGSDYKVNKLAIYDADLHYNDYTLSEKFSIGLNPFTVWADSVDKNRKWVDINLKSDIKPFGNLIIKLHLNPKDKEDFDMSFRMSNLSAPMFNPFLVKYTSFPLDRGSVELQSEWTVRNGQISSMNHLILLDPRVTKRVKNKDTKWIPMPLIMAFVREYGNVIDYEIPIKGDLNDPKFKYRDIIFDLLKNILIKPPTTPYRMNVKSIEAKVEKSLTLVWSRRQTKLRPPQERFVKKIAEFLKDNPEASISIYPIQYTEKEKESILFYEAKKKYFLVTRHKKEASFTEEDSVLVEKMSTIDPGFEGYMDRILKDKMLFTIQDKCRRFVGNELVNKRFNQLSKNRENDFISFFKENGTNTRVKILSVGSEVPFRGFSYFNIKYKGEIPDVLLKATEDLEEINETKPRKKYRFFRKNWFNKKK